SLTNVDISNGFGRRSTIPVGSNRDAVVIPTAVAHQIKGLRIANNYFSGYFYGIRTSPIPAGALVDDIVVEGNYFERNAATGFSAFIAARSLIIRNNVFRTTGANTGG